jgi:hypothetical protein
MAALHVFQNDDQSASVIAESADEALMLYAEFCGYDDLASYQEDTEDSVSAWTQVPDDKTIKIFIEDDDAATAMPASAWVREQGKGYLAGGDV